MHVVCRVTGKRVAMKVQKSASHYTEAAWDEIKLLMDAREGTPEGVDSCVVDMTDYFEHKGPHGTRMCIVFCYLCFFVCLCGVPCCNVSLMVLHARSAVLTSVVCRCVHGV